MALRSSLSAPTRQLWCVLADGFLVALGFASGLERLEDWARVPWICRGERGQGPDCGALRFGHGRFQLWDAASYACVGTCAFGAPKPAAEDMQVGVVWSGSTIISLSLRGELTYLDAANLATPKMVVRGHNKNITALASDAAGGVLVSASYDGILNKFTLGQPAAQVCPAALSAAAARRA